MRMETSLVGHQLISVFLFIGFGGIKRKHNLQKVSFAHSGCMECLGFPFLDTLVTVTVIRMPFEICLYEITCISSPTPIMCHCSLGVGSNGSYRPLQTLKFLLFRTVLLNSVNLGKTGLDHSIEKLLVSWQYWLWSQPITREIEVSQSLGTQLLFDWNSQVKLEVYLICFTLGLFLSLMGMIRVNFSVHRRLRPLWQYGGKH